MFGSTCSSKDCQRPSSGLLSGMCHFHEALASARELSPEEFDSLREALATTPPLTQEERRARRVRSSLRTVEWNARDLARAKKRAREAGATAGQVEEAKSRGKAAA